VGIGGRERNIAWISWENMCDSIEEGDLGVINIRLFNNALLGNWIWRLKTVKAGMWREILDSKYGRWKDLKSNRK